MHTNRRRRRVVGGSKRGDARKGGCTDDKRILNWARVVPASSHTHSDVSTRAFRTPKMAQPLLPQPLHSQPLLQQPLNPSPLFQQLQTATEEPPSGYISAPLPAFVTSEDYHDGLKVGSAP